MRVGWVWSNDTGGPPPTFGVATFADAVEGIVRTSGLVGASSDYACCGWFHVAGTPSIGTFRSFLYSGDDPVGLYVDYVWIGQRGNDGGANDGKLQLNISGGAATYGPVLTAGFHFLAYVRSGNVHTIYVDGAIATTQTVNIAAATFTHLYLGTDTYAVDWDPGKAAYFREWDAAKTVAQLQAERFSDTLVDATDLWSNAPLIDDLLDISGNGRDWADDGGTITFTLPLPAIPTKFYVLRWSYTDSWPWVPDFIPTAWQGGWDSTNQTGINSATLNYIDPLKDGWTSSSLSRAETSAANPFTVGICRFITRNLAAQTIQGMFDVILAISESDVAADFYWKVYVYVTVGETDAVRGVCLDYEDDAIEWPTTSTGTGLPASQTLSPVVAQANDRFVIELGYVSRNSVTTSRSGTIRLGAMTAVLGLTGLADLAVGSTTVTTTVGSILFSQPPVLLTPPSNDTFAGATVLTVALSETVNLDGAMRDGDEPEPCLGDATPTNAVGRYSSVWYTWACPHDQYATFTSEISGTVTPFNGVLVVLTGTPGAFVEVACSGSNAVDQVTFAATQGVTYTIMVATRVYWGGDLTFTFTPDVAAPTAPVRTILVNSDIGGASRSVTLDATTGDVIEVFDFISGEPGDRVASGIFAIGKNAGGAADITAVNVYQPDRTLIASVSGLTHPGNWDRLSPVRSNNLDLFYVAPKASGGSVAVTLQTVDITGAIGAQTWALPATANGILAMVPALDNTILYYGQGVSPGSTAVFRYDLINSVALPDLVPTGTVDAWGREALIVPAGLLMMCQRTGNFDDDDFAVRLIDINTGATIRDFALGNAAGSDPILARDPDSAYFWTYVHPVVDYVNFLAAPSIFTRWKVSDGSVDVTFTVLTEDIGGLVPLSCPFFVFGPAGPPPACPGILGAPRIGV